MSEYIISSSEKTQESATEQETKTMLYLMGFMKDSKNVESFLIDVYNDVTAVSKDGSIYWDSQSKGDDSSSLYSIGEDLVTLYKNYISVFEFDYYILSLKYISDNNIIDSRKPLSNMEILKYNDFTDDAKKLIKEGLLKQCNEKNYISETHLCKIDSFLKEMYVVVNNKPKSDYIKKISFMKDELIKEDIINDIFDSIRKIQVGIKTRKNINGEKLRTRDEAFKFNRTLTVKAINSFILGRIIGNDIINKNSNVSYCPILFNEYVNKHSLDIEDIKCSIQNAVNGIYLMLLNENLNKDFWDLIYAILKECEKKDVKVYDVYDKIKKDYSHMIYVQKCEEVELVYLISCVLGEKNNEN